MRISLQLDMEELKLNPSNVRLNSETRLYGLDIPIIGLTGGIATGKSTVSSALQALGAPVIDADILIKFIYNQADTLYLTFIDLQVDGDTRFPDWLEVADWQQVSHESHQADEKNSLAYEFVTLNKK